jgi:hypothetical protein
MQINPQIDNLRVVSCRDSEMVLLDYQDISNFAVMANQNNAADASVIHANLDEMAKALAQEATASAAWAEIFRKPAAKQWADVKVAIKVNCISENHPRVAVVGKICGVLNTLGVPFGNIILYDSCHNAASFYPAFVGNGLPSGVLVSNRSSLLGGDVSTPVPDQGNHDCPADIANGNVDILVNCAVNKGHSSWNGNCTLTMKNHYGTFSPDNHSNMSYIVGINKSNAIVGGTPVRQQLCIIDSLWGMTYGPGGTPNHNTYRLIMGTFGPAVDYLTAIRVREDEMGVGHNTNIDSFLTAFGYSTTDRDNLTTLTPEQNDGKGWVEVTPASQVGPMDGARGAVRRGLTLTTGGRGRQSSHVRFLVAERAQRPVISIHDARGRTVRVIEPGNTPVVYWDGLSSSGKPVSAGTYAVRLRQGDHTDSRSLTLR